MEEKLFRNTVALINRLYGYFMRVKEIHWINTNGNVHELMDNLSWHINDKIDKIMEIVLSKFGRESLSYQSICPDIIVCDDPEDLVNRMNEDLVKYKKVIPEDEEYAGLKSTIDQMIADVNIDTYRSKLE